jgi:mannosyltransferase
VTASAQPAQLPEHAGQATITARRPGRRRTWSAWMPVLPGLVTLAVTLWRIGTPSFWRDEAATLTATRRSLPEMIRMLAHVDAVHGAYYLTVWPLAHVFGTSEFVMRLPSAVAMAAAACCTAVLGRRLASAQTGLLAGLVFALLPMTSRFGQEARSYAMVTAVAAASSYLLLRAIGEPGRRWAAGYGVSLVALGFLNMFGLLIIPAHAITLALARRHGSAGPSGEPPGGGATGRQGTPAGRGTPGWAGASARGWVIAAAVALVAIVPIAALAWHERFQLAWLKKPAAGDVWTLATSLTGSSALFVAVTALGVTGAVSQRRGRRRAQATAVPAGERLYWLSVPWLFVPPAVLIIVSEIKPVYVDRYVVFCLPALALLAGAGLAAVGRYWQIAALALIAVATLPAQQAIRLPAGHADDIRAAAAVLRQQAKPGDAVVWFKPGFRDLGAVYPGGFGRLLDIGLKDSATAAGNLSGTEVALPVLESRLRGQQRVWLIEVDRNQPDPAVIGSPPFQLVRVWRVHGFSIRLYDRSG